MTEMILTKTRIAEGVWEGRLQQEAAQPDTPPPAIRVTLSGKPVPGAELEPEATALGLYTLRVPIPVEALGEGLHTFLILDDASGRTLGSFAMALGAPLESDIRAELDLLRAELDLLKRAFRRHCSETG
jgi:hypothetical protein